MFIKFVFYSRMIGWYYEH